MKRKIACTLAVLLTFSLCPMDVSAHGAGHCHSTARSCATTVSCGHCNTEGCGGCYFTDADEDGICDACGLGSDSCGYVCHEEKTSYKSSSSCHTYTRSHHSSHHRGGHRGGGFRCGASRR